MSEATIKNFSNQIDKIRDDFKQEIRKLRTSRPSTELVEDILVEVYGAKTPLKHLASISVSPPNIIIVEIWDRSILSNIKKSIMEANLGLNPVEDGNSLKLYLPSLSQERKKELINVLSKKKEEARIKIRQLRDDFLKMVKKDFENNEISEDEMFSFKKELQKKIEEINQELENIEEQKIKEIENS
ncbi:MAG TPA: ribosome recycling factor [Candidatus Paceibacterota bacterium]|jgi:ribosome recycling factor|nr:ribosome recycling factor [Candidatus Paceibacterota bacterium]